MSNNIKVSYNLNYIKNNIFWDIKNVIFKCKGIIYGGFVRDYIISQHYKNLFWNKYDTNQYSGKDFWNEKIDNDTLLRTLNPNDIDACVYSESDLDNMITEITSIINCRFGITNVKVDNSFIPKTANDYIDRPCGSFYSYDFKILFGVIPYISDGVEFNIKIDVVVSNSKYLMPPFKKLDFICNGFVMTSHEIVNLSSCTGTGIDNLSFVEKKEIEFKIIRDIINLRTDYCMKFPNTTEPYMIVKYNEQACKRIEKMANKKIMWNIRNMPVIIEKHKESYKKKEEFKELCCICCDTINNNEKKITIPVFDSNNKVMCGSYFHMDCFFKYLSSQIQNKISEIASEESNIDNTFLRCPLRNNIDFNCKNFSEIIDGYLKN